MPASFSDTAEIPKSVWKLQAGKAPGSDGWLSEFIKLLKDVLQGPFEDILRVMFRAGETADLLDQDIKKPFAKPGKSGEHPKELRPVTLLCELGKMLEGWMRCLWNNSFRTSEEQAGFKTGYSCVGRLFVLQTVVQWNLSALKNNCYGVLVDFLSFFET